MSEVHHWRSLQKNSTANSNEADRDISASAHRNVLSWAVWRGHKEKKSVSFAALTPAASSQAVPSTSCSIASSLLRTRSVPDVVGPNPSTSPPAQKVSTALDAVCASSMRFLTPRPFGKGGFSKTKNSTKMSNSQSKFCGQTSSMVKPNVLRQTYSPSDRLAVKGPRKKKEQVVQSEKDGRLEGSPNEASRRTSFSSHIQFDISPSSVLSAVFLVKSLCISLEDLKTNPTLYMSTLSCHLGVSSLKKYKTTNHKRRASRCRESGLSHCRGLQSKQQSHKVKQIAPAHSACSVDSDLHTLSAAPRLLSFRGPSPPYIKATKLKGNADEEVQAAQGNIKHRPHTVDARSWDKQSREEEERLEGDCDTEPNKRTSLNTYKTCYYHSRLKGDTVDGAAKSLSLQEALELLRPDFINRSQSRLRRLEQRATRRRAGSDSDLSFREAPGKLRRSCTTPDPQKRNCTTPDPQRRNCTTPDPLRRSCITPDPQKRNCTTPDPQRRNCTTPDPLRRSCITPDPQRRNCTTLDPLRRSCTTPDPLRRSCITPDPQKMSCTTPDPLRRNCTTPDPLSDNLFKPRERAISGREMQLRSRRIYNKLPEVTRRKEEEKRRAVSQTNRLRAEVYKKKLLDQVLQR